jgi:hypothetical protein
MIFAWLKREGREDERTSVYGGTRAWSKFGSAFSLPVAVALVLVTDDYSVLFLACSIPYLLNILNLASYPSWLDFDSSTGSKVGVLCRKTDGCRAIGLSAVLAALRTSLSDAFRVPRLRRILLESMCYEGLFKTAKDYIQPVLVALVASVAFCPEIPEVKQVAILTGLVYFILHLLSGFTAARAGGFREKAGGDEKASDLLWWFELCVFLFMGGAILAGIAWLVVLMFVVMAIAQNLWRPLLVGRCAACCDENRMATLLSIESQAKSFFIFIFAPLVGWWVDSLARTNKDERFIPIAVLGVAVSLLVLFLRRKQAREPSAVCRLSPGDDD